MKVSELVERVEAASEESDGLFFDAFEAAFGTPGHYHPAYAKFRQWSQTGAWLDAAMTLVPEHCWVRFDQWPGEKATASVLVIAEPPVDASSGKAATAALALTAAALRAREDGR